MKILMWTILGDAHDREEDWRQAGFEGHEFSEVDDAPRRSRHQGIEAGSRSVDWNMPT